jgi:putative YhdH/YhfP family quinone oxidoreductase
MTAIPRTFRAYVVERQADRMEQGVRTMTEPDLPPGEVEVRVTWSTVNYKDALTTRVEGKVARISPLIPGIDLAGEVIASAAPAFRPGDQVIASGYELGVSRHGGLTEYARVPAGRVLALPAGLSARDAMTIGTAGFTAAMSVLALEAHGLTPEGGPVLVTGATGGVGSIALSILGGRGYEVWALTGKADAADWLRRLGVAGLLSRADAPADGPALEPERWAAVVETAGAPTLPYALRSTHRGGAVALSGNAGGARFTTSVFPFILRGVSLLGMDSAYLPLLERRQIWERLATDLRPRHLDSIGREVALDDLGTVFESMLAGRARGRWVVRIAG